MILCVGIILVREDGSVLGQLRDDKPGILNPNSWGIVGGGIMEDVDRDLFDVGIRELSEETGYLANRNDLRYLGTDNFTLSSGVEIKRVVLWARYDGVQNILTNEGQEIRFVEPKEFSRIKFAIGNEAYFRKASEKMYSRGVEIRR